MGQKNQLTAEWDTSSLGGDQIVTGVVLKGSMSGLMKRNSKEGRDAQDNTQVQVELSNSVLSSQGNSDSGTNVGSDNMDSNSEADSNEKMCLEKLQSVMSPLFYSLYLSGLFYKKRPRFHPSKIYSRIVLIILWLDCLRQFSIFRSNTEFDTPLFLNIVSVNYKVMAVIGASVCHYAAGSTNGIHEYFEAWSELITVKKTSKCNRFARKKAFIHTTMCWVLVVFSAGYTIYGLYYMESFESMLTPFSSDWRYTYVIKAVSIPLSIFMCLAYFFPVLLYYSTCSLIYWLFEELNHDFSGIEDRNTALKSVETYRRRHQKICRLVGRANDIFHVMVAVQMAGNVVALCMMIYIVIHIPVSEATFIAGIVIWIALSVLSIVVTSLAAGYVNISAHKMADLLYELDLSEATDKEISQVTFFHSRLTGTVIGLSALKLIIIDKRNLLTLLGLIVTYLIVLAEFSSQDSSDDVCDCLRDIVNSALNISVSTTTTA